MGKYLQDVRFYIELENGQKTFSDVQRIAQSICNLIQVLFNLYLPKKIIVGENIWGITVHLTLDKNKDKTVKEYGLRFDSYLYYDCTQLIDIENLMQKRVLLDLALKGINQCCKPDNICLKIFKEIYDKILEDNILYDSYYKDRKTSPNKELSAQMKGYYCENYEDRKLYLSVFNKENIEIKSILIGNYNFQAFDRIKWADNEIVFVYHINNLQSYKSKKVAEDYYAIDIKNECVTYHPVTKESMFDYGVQLLTETKEIDKAISYLSKVRELGHGKVENIFKNLEINPMERNKSILLQTPKRK